MSSFDESSIGSADDTVDTNAGTTTGSSSTPTVSPPPCVSQQGTASFAASLDFCLKLLILICIFPAVADVLSEFAENFPDEYAAVWAHPGRKVEAYYNFFLKNFCNWVASRLSKVNAGNKKKELKEKAKKFLASEMINNNWKTHVLPSSKRHYLVVDEVGIIDDRKKIRDVGILSTFKGIFNSLGCVLCGVADDNLLKCGPGSKCSSVWHLECIKMYNADSFFFQYASRPECQNKMLCPLHFCASCNVERRCQSAGFLQTGEAFIECCQCLRAFHSKCVPAGSKWVNVDIDGVSKTMIICPSHFSTEIDIAQHIGICCHERCMRNDPLIDCKTCIRSFHRACNPVVSFGGQSDLGDQCERCLRSSSVRTNVLVVQRRNGKVRLGVTQQWEAHPNKDEEVGNELGKVVVKWLSGIVSFTVEYVKNVAVMTERYLPAFDQDEKSAWESSKDDFAVKKLLPAVNKKVVHFENRSKVVHKDNFKDVVIVHVSGVCYCSGPNRCTSLDKCVYLADDMQCPKGCKDVVGGCNNQSIAKDLRFPLKVELRETEGKGFGIFAREQIEQDEFLVEYHGERIGNAEKLRRLEVVAMSGDMEANRYMMEANPRITIDAVTHGNEGRYFNHSCNPNARAIRRLEFVSEEKGQSKFRPRMFIKSTRSIPKDEEVTIMYGMTNEDGMLPPCQCGEPECQGTLGAKTVKRAPTQAPRPRGRPRKRAASNTDEHDKTKMPRH